MTLPLTSPIATQRVPFLSRYAVEDKPLRLLPCNGRRGAPLQSNGLMRDLATRLVFKSEHTHEIHTLLA